MAGRRPVRQPGPATAGEGSGLAQFDCGQALAPFGDARFQRLTGLEIDDLRLTDRLHVNEDILALLALPGAVEEAVALDSIEPFDLHRLILARGVGQGLAVRVLAG